jgi:hypothetical protein
MSKLFFSILMLGALAFACSENESGVPGCEVNGVWYGSWRASNQADSGYYTAMVDQNGTAIGGRVAVSMQSDPNTIYGADFTGKLKDLIYGGSVEVSIIDVTVSGRVTPDSLAPGNFSVPALSMSGPYSARRLPAIRPVMREIYSESSAIDEAYTNIMAVNNELWCVKSGYVRINDTELLQVDILNFDGQLVRTSHFPLTNTNLFTDGTYIYSLNNYMHQLVQYNTEGDTISEIEFDGNVDGFCLATDGETIFVPYGMHSSVMANFSGQITDTLVNPYHRPYNPLLIDNKIFYSFDGQIYSMSFSGNILKAWLINNQINLAAMTYANGKIYCLQRELSAGDDFVRIVEVTL